MAFTPDPRIVETLARQPESALEQRVWKHTLPGQPPEASNTKGARWNPTDVPAIYLALERATAMAEGEYLVAQQPVPISGVRHIYEGEVSLRRVLDLRDPALLSSMGVSAAELSSMDHYACRQVGGAAEWLGMEAIIVPSARSEGANLVVFERRMPADFEVSFGSADPI